MNHKKRMFKQHKHRGLILVDLIERKNKSGKSIREEFKYGKRTCIADLRKTTLFYHDNSGGILADIVNEALIVPKSAFENGRTRRAYVELVYSEPTQQDLHEVVKHFKRRGWNPYIVIG